MKHGYQHASLGFCIQIPAKLPSITASTQELAQGSDILGVLLRPSLCQGRNIMSQMSTLH